jgi:hypothetical protein
MLEKGTKKVVDTFTSVKKAMEELPTNANNFFKDLPKNLDKLSKDVPAKLKTSAIAFEEWAGRIVTGVGTFTRNAEKRLNEAGPAGESMGENAWKSIQKLGHDISNNIQWFLGAVASAQLKVNSWFAMNLPKIGQWATGLIGTLAGVQNKVSAWISNPSSWGKLVTSIQNGFNSALANLKLPNLGAWLQKKFDLGYKPNGKDGGKDGDPTTANAFGSPGIGFSSLSKAVAFENKHKPPGSSLVVANSSETIIPAAYGFIPSQGMYSSSRSGMSSAPISVSAPITIHQQPGQDAEELASMVAMKIGEAVAQARSASVFV